MTLLRVTPKICMICRICYSVVDSENKEVKEYSYLIGRSEEEIKKIEEYRESGTLSHGVCSECAKDL